MTDETIIGSIVGDRYEVLSILGHGGLGTVYLAKHRVIDRMVALKVLSKTIDAFDTSNKDYLRFEREAKLASALNHPNIVSVFDFGLSTKRFPYLVMDYIEGESLESLLCRSGSLQIDRALPIFLGLAKGMAHAHKKGIVHRDLKPTNVMLAESEEGDVTVKIVDFGIAKAFNEDIRDGSGELTTTGTALGTPAYMSPEQCMGKQVDHRSDIYSLGCIMYRALTGTRPIEGSNSLELISKQVTETPRPFADANANLSCIKPVEEVVFQALSKDPDVRHQSMNQLAAHLEQAFQSINTEDATSFSAHPSGSRSIHANRIDSRPPIEPRHRDTGCIDARPIDSQENIEISQTVKANFNSYAELPLKDLNRKAESGDSAAQYEMGWRLQIDDPIAAFNWYDKAARAGNADAQYALADMYTAGSGTACDITAGMHWYRQAAEAGHSDAQYALGAQLEATNGESSEEAVHWYRKSAQQGNKWGRSSYGRSLLFGLGTKKNIDEGLHWLWLSVDEDDMEFSMYALAFAYEDGIDVDQDLDKAFELYKRAAKIGHIGAQHDLGRCYELGKGTEKNDELAYKWYQASADAGNSDAQSDLDKLLDRKPWLAKVTKKKPHT